MSSGPEEHTGSGHTVTAGGSRIAGDVHAGHDFVGRDKVVYGDEIGRDKIVNQGQLIIQQTLSAIDEAEKARALESARLAQGVGDYVKRLLAVTTQEIDACAGGPYRGLVAYGLGDAEIFFGREHAIEVLGGYLQRSKLTVIQSESGAGKTSLLQAGVAPRLLTGGHLPLILRPYTQSPTISITQAFLPNVQQISTLAKAPLRAFLSQVTAVLGQDTILFIILDQFEEFFTLLPEAESREAFVNDLAECLEDPTLNVRWVLALRSDFFGDLAGFRPRIRNPFENDFRLNRLTSQDARAIIVKPAQHCGIECEQSLVDALLEDLTQPDGRIAPPQVQLVCLALHNAYQDRKAADPSLSPILTLNLYREEGAARGILRGHLNRVLRRALPKAEQRDLAHQLLISLISSDQRRVRRTRSELARQFAAGTVLARNIDEVLDELVANRLVNVEQEEAQQEATYELAHDYLLDEIRIAPEVLAQKAAQELLDQEVEAHQRFGTLLNTDKFEIINSQRAHLTLDEAADELLQQSEHAIRAVEHEREAARRRQLSRTRVALAASLIALLLATAVGWQLYDQYRKVVLFRLVTEAQQSKTALEPYVAVEKLRSARQAAAKAGVDLGIDVTAAISDTLRYVATQWTYQGEELVRQARVAPAAERQKNLERATRLFQDARALEPPADAHVYVMIPAGAFLMGSSDAELDQALELCKMVDDSCERAWFQYEQPQHAVYLEDYWMMRSEVTNEQYGRCVRAGVCKEPANTRWNLDSYGRQPVTDVDLTQAQAYAQWVGGRLPTEAEWEKACRGIAGNVYPWGDTPPRPGLLNFGESGLNGLTVVGSFPPGAFGLYDMVGNVEEWTSSSWGQASDSPDFGYPYTPGDGRENDDASNHMLRVFRGGSASRVAYGVRCARRGRAESEMKDHERGFRVVLPAR